MQTQTIPRRACRHEVSWSGRVRSVAEQGWHPGHILNLSVSGVLLETERHYDIGERVEVEIDFLTRPHATTIISGVGRVIRADGEVPRRTAIAFIVECELARKAV